MSSFLGDYAYKVILEMIWSGEIKPDEIYSLTQLSQELSISRTPLRNAIQRLSDEKRVDILPSRGFCLHKLTDIEIRQRYHLTIAIEGYSIIRLIEKYSNNKDDEDVKKIEECVEMMAQGLLSNALFKENYRLDNLFHNALIDSLDDDFSEYLSIRDHGFANIPELHLYSRSLDMKRMLQYNQRTLNAIKNCDSQEGYKSIIENADYVYNIYMREANRSRKKTED